jgi:hypothetical protein
METGDSRKVGGAEKGLEFKGSSRALMRCFWKNIRNGWKYFSNLVSFKVGDGSGIHFGMMCGAKQPPSSLFFHNFIK